MSKTRNMIVQSQTEVRAAKDMGLSESCIRIGNSIKKNDGITDKILEDVFEALIGAIYLDQGEKKAYKVIKNTIIHYFEINSLKGAIDYKTLLQEKTQALFKCRPKYHKKHSIDGQLMVEV
jgi:ribonuclease-3